MFHGGDTALQAECGRFDSSRVHQFFIKTTVGVKGGFKSRGLARVAPRLALIGDTVISRTMSSTHYVVAVVRRVYFARPGRFARLSCGDVMDVSERGSFRAVSSVGRASQWH